VDRSAGLVQLSATADSSEPVQSESLPMNNRPSPRPSRGAGAEPREDEHRIPGQGIRDPGGSLGTPSNRGPEG
jgi:hypothetical protein